MHLRCRLFGHEWQGCICPKCKTSRDLAHDWGKDCEKCVQCGKTRANVHDWGKDCEKCVQCGRTRANAHDWGKDCEKCVQCGKTRANAHDWGKDCEKCVRCGRTRANAHDWGKDCEKCVRCGKTRANAHDWGKDCEKCVRCGSTRALVAEREIVRLQNALEHFGDRAYDERQEKSRESLRALGGHAVKPLIAALKDKNWLVRTDAVSLLGDLGDSQAVDPLVSALNDKDSLVGERAAKALGKLGDKRAIEPLFAALDGGKPWKATSGGDRRLGAALALCDLGDNRSVELLSAILGDPSADRWTLKDVIRRLGKIRDSRAVEPLINALSDQHDDVRVAAAKALGDIGDARIREPLLSAVRNDRNLDVRRASGQALTTAGMAPSLGRFVNALSGAGGQSRIEATRYLGAFGNDEHVQPLIATLRDSDEELRDAALDALLGIGGDSRRQIKDFFGSDPQRWFKEPCARARPNNVYNPNLANKQEWKEGQYRRYDSLEEWAGQVSVEPRRKNQFTLISVGAWGDATHALFGALKRRFQVESADAVRLFDTYLFAICEDCSYGSDGHMLQMSSGLSKMINVPTRGTCARCGGRASYVMWRGDKLHDIFYGEPGCS